MAARDVWRWRLARGRRAGLTVRYRQYRQGILDCNRRSRRAGVPLADESDTKSRIERWLASRRIAIGACVLSARLRPPRLRTISRFSRYSRYTLLADPDVVRGVVGERRDVAVAGFAQHRRMTSPSYRTLPAAEALPAGLRRAAGMFSAEPGTSRRRQRDGLTSDGRRGRGDAAEERCGIGNIVGGVICDAAPMGLFLPTDAMAETAPSTGSKTLRSNRRLFSVIKNRLCPMPSAISL